MSPFFIKALQLLLSLSFLIVLHELGHFIPAKLFKTRVEKFFLFFDVKFALFKKKIGDTVYGIGWLPLGGYVKISGMIDESMDKEQMAKPPEPWEFRSKPAWQRLIIMIGGVTVNIILGFLIYAMVLFVWGSPKMTNSDMPDGLLVTPTMEELGLQDGDKVTAINGKTLDNIMTKRGGLMVNQHIMMREVSSLEVQHQSGEREQIAIPEDIGDRLFKSGEMLPFSVRIDPIIVKIREGSNADKAGLKVGDRITAVNDQEIETWQEFREIASEHNGEPLRMTLLNEGEERIVTAQADENNVIGFEVNMNLDAETMQYSLGESIVEGFDLAYWTLHDYVAQFKYVFTKKGATQVGGFGAIGSMFPDMWDWQSFWLTTALISIILAFMNILPIPALDGGHVMFLLYEMISGRKPGEKFLEYAQMVGFFILIALVLFANGNDIYRWLFE